ncbi:GTP cyclohydrolase I [Actinomadura violacea]|uniref:GTP cyclohydrolase 1 n=1 Tax=Actinomadura violacea TaxID=2819934 RepID=A0ABS3RZW1_9ACTN|nr:GTP cyclohydrolase I [Actinomadura violacea]MBO2461589.1 GTP cyclohydrolase I [Actinomadura violacea]
MADIADVMKGDWTPFLRPGQDGDPDNGDCGVQLGDAIRHARAMFAALGMPCDQEGTTATPDRFVRAMLELTAGLRVDPDRHFARTFPAPSADPGIIIVPGIRFTSVCEHHALAFTGTMAVGYLPRPGAPVVGLSKLARVAREYAARPQMQERLGDQIVQAITRSLDTDGAACVIRSQHSCMTLRGARADGAAMVTSHMRGQFRESAALRNEFLTLANQPG